MLLIYLFLLIINICVIYVVQICVNCKNDIISNTKKLIEEKKSFLLIYCLMFIIIFFLSFLSYSSTSIMHFFISTYLKISTNTTQFKSSFYSDYYENYYKDVLYLLVSLIFYSLVFIFIYKKILTLWWESFMLLFTKLENFIIIILNIIFLLNLLIILINILNLSFLFIKIWSFSNKYNVLITEKCRDFRKKKKTYRGDECVQKYIDDDFIIKKKLITIKKNHKSTYESIMDNFEILFYKFKNFVDNTRLSVMAIKKFIVDFKNYFLYKINFLNIKLYKTSIIHLIRSFKEYFKCICNINNYQTSNIFNFTNNYKFFYNFFYNSIKISTQSFIKMYDFFISEFRLLRLAFVEMNFIIFFLIFSAMLYTLICIFLFFIYENIKFVYKFNYCDFKISYCKYKFKKHKRFIVPKLYCFLFFIFKYIQYLIFPYWFYIPTFISSTITSFLKIYIDPHEYIVAFLLLLLFVFGHYDVSQKLKKNKTYTFLFFIYILVIMFCLYLSSLIWITTVLIIFYMGFFYFSLFYIIVNFFKRLINWLRDFFE